MGNGSTKGESASAAASPVTDSKDAYVDQHKFVLADPIEGVKIESLYNMKEELGSGAFSTVFRAINKDTGEAVAIKHISKKEVNSKEDVENLREEVAILRQIHHPHVMRCMGFYSDAKFFSVVTELVIGGELFDRIVEKKHYNELIARDLVKIFLDTLDFMHSNGIVHRDLKPENLLLADRNDDTNIKIADFGFAKHISEPLNTVCGTPDYIAPEVCALLDLKKVPKEKRPCYGTGCDIWSAGVIVYILLGGYPPFFDENRNKLFKKIKAGIFEFHDQYWSGTSPEAKDLIRKMLTVDPRKRPSAKDLLSHPWIMAGSESLQGKDLGGTVTELKRYNARRKFKGTVKAILATMRIQSALGGGINPIAPSGPAEAPAPAASS